MDKFGIFNVLSALLGQSAGQTVGKSDDDSYLSPPPVTGNAESGEAEKRAALPPLKNSMLATMKTHDEFVKRVRAQTAKDKK